MVAGSDYYRAFASGRAYFLYPVFGSGAVHLHFVLMNNKRKAKLFKLLGITKLPYLPFSLGLEPGNLCNLRCPLCPTGNDEPGLAKGFMSLELFKRVFDQLKGSLDSINLYSWGEPLLNKDLIPIIKYAKSGSRKISITTSTNLSIKDGALLAGLIASGIDEIIVSCDGATCESYSKYRVGGDFNLVMDNLRLLAAKKRELNAPADIVWNFLVFKHNEGEVEQARRAAESIGVSFRVGLMRTSMKDEILKPHKEAISKDKDWIPDNPQYSAYDKEECAPKKIIKGCRKPWQEITINWDGKVFPCCAVYGDKYSFGDARNTPVKEIWNNKAFIVARREILNKKKHACTVCGLCRDNGFMHM